MSDKMIFKGINTNNLKNIDVTLEKNKINLILGPSGSGKSSLAYDTISVIGLHELSSMFSDEEVEPIYKIKSYSNIITTVPIKQINKNNNIRSTIGTYFGLNHNISLLYSVHFNKPNDFFVLNKVENTCPKCKGIGYIKKLDEYLIIDYNKMISELPFKLWNRNTSFYNQILEQYCIDCNIDYNKKFKNLTKVEKDMLLTKSSANKYSIKYKSAGRIVSRTTKYHGALTEIPMLKKFKASDKFYSNQICPHCDGKKYSQEHLNFKLCKLSIGEMMTTTFKDLKEWIDEVTYTLSNQDLDFAISRISNFISKAIELDLGHLSFHRTIPTLSGGEFQRLKLVQVFNTQLTNLLIVLDEPLAGLNKIDRDRVYINIKSLIPKHTLLIVDHHNTFLEDAGNIIVLGLGSGTKGGNLITYSQYKQLNEINSPSLIDDISEIKLSRVKLKRTIRDYNGVDIALADGLTNIITGRSGTGKTTLLKEYFPQIFDDYEYINQKPITGKNNSFVATLLNINGRLINLYSKEYNKPKSFFSKLSNGDGACNTCKGLGYIQHGNDYQISIKSTCSKCSGTGFNNKLSQYKINNKSLIDIWNMSLDEVLEVIPDPKITEQLNNASKLLLGHLKIGQQTTTLSGGENLRIKLLRAISSKASTLGIDEPFRGLSGTEITSVIKILHDLTKNNKTIIVVDHIEETYQYFHNRVLLKNVNNLLKGDTFK